VVGKAIAAEDTPNAKLNIIYYMNIICKLSNYRIVFQGFLESFYFIVSTYKLLL
jgi:hypothetical protein